MSSIQSLVSSIISQRKISIDEVKEKIQCLEYLASKISELINIKTELISIVSKNPQATDDLSKIDLSQIKKIVLQEQRVWRNLLNRFSRNTINIGVVGLARQGKSTFLQSVAGLDDSIIPSSDGMPCTSVKSIIYHADRETCASVYFYSEKSFLEKVIWPYYRELGFDNLPLSISQFKSASLPPAPVNPRKQSTAGAIYKHLSEEYYRGIDQYGKFLKPEEYREDVNETSRIKEYVSQQYSNSKSISFTHLAVDRVEISCRFPRAGVEQIGLVDMPGLGDTRLGDAERMIEALAQDVDFILFVRKPNSDGDSWKDSDLQLYDAAYQSLQNKLPLEEWSFMLLNEDGRNDRNCDDLEKTLTSKTIRVKKLIRANCKDPNAANEVLNEVLKYLTNNIVRLDHQYMLACNSSLKQVQTQVESELSLLKTIIDSCVDDNSRYVMLKDEFITQIFSRIEAFRENIRNKEVQIDPEFKAQIDIAIQQCKQNPGIPDIQKIHDLTKQRGIDHAYFWSIQKMRPNLLKNFHQIDYSLKASLNLTKSEIANQLISLGLDVLTDKKGSEFLATLASELPANLKNLKLGFNFIASFEVLYRGTIQENLWQVTNQVLPPYPDRPVGTPNNGENIVTFLQECHNLAVEKCRVVLEDVPLFLKKVERAMVEEFSDHITRAEGVEQEWEVLLSKYRSKIWSQLAQMENNKQIEDRWMKLIEESLLINRKLHS